MMGPYPTYNDNDKSDKDNLKEEFDSSSTTYGSENPLDANDEAESFLPFKGSLGRTLQARSRYKRFLLSPLFTIVVLFLMIALLGTNIVTVVLLNRFANGVHPPHPPHHNGMAHQSNMGETVNEKGLRVAPNGKLLECGEKAIDARDNGCIFDLMAYEWTPPACYDDELLREATDPRSVLAPSLAGIFPWGKTADAVFDEPLEQDADSLGTLPFVWTTEDWHKAHCMYMWRILTKAQNLVLQGATNIYVPIGAISQGHISHCNVLMSDKADGAKTALEAFRTVTTCVRLDKPQQEDRNKHANGFDN